jgi:hypothetical protein
MISISYVEKSVDTWHKLLRIRTLVIDPKDEPHLYVKFADLCRNNGRSNLALRTLMELAGADLSSFDKKNIPATTPLVSYAIMKHTIQMGDFATARYQLRMVLSSLRSSYENHPEDPQVCRLMAKLHIHSGDLYQIGVIKSGRKVSIFFIFGSNEIISYLSEV